MPGVFTTMSEADYQEGVDAFDRAYFERYGRYPEESPLYGTQGPRSDTARRQAILNLIEGGATEGERDAAREALRRIDQDAQDEADYEDALMHGEA